MISSDMDSSDTGSSSETGSSSDPKATENSQAAVDETKSAAENQSSDQSAMSPSDALADAVKQAAGSAKQRPGSSLILIPPVTRKGEGIHANASQSDEASAASANKGFGRAAALGEGLRAQFNAKCGMMKDKWQRYAIPAALGLCLFGVGIATGGQFLGGAGKSLVFGAADPRLTQAALDQTEMHKVTKKLNDEIHALQVRLDSMHASAQGGPGDVHSLTKSVDALRASLDALKTETSAQINDLDGKVAHLQHEEARGQPFDKSGHDQHAVAGLVTGGTEMHPGVNPANANAIHTGTQTSNTTLHPPAPATTGTTNQHAQHGDTQTALAGPPSPKDQPPSPDAKKKPQQMLVGWVVRDVYRGVALIDGPDGTIEVAKGDVIQGAGTVESIEHRNGSWVLVTSRGIVGSVHE